MLRNWLLQAQNVDFQISILLTVPGIKSLLTRNVHKCHTCGKQHFLHQTGPEQRSHYEICEGLIGITLCALFTLSKIKKYDTMTVFHKYDVDFYNVRFQQIVPNNFDQTTLICIVWYQMWYMW